MLTTEQKNKVLEEMAQRLEAARSEILALNKVDVDEYDGADSSMYDRLKINDKKVDGMIQSVLEVRAEADPVGCVRYAHTRADGLRIENRSVPFGTILIIYESRPDVTIEAAALAFKAGNRILLKGGKEARRTNLKLVEIWHESLRAVGVSTDFIQYLDFDRTATQAFLRAPSQRVDLIVPRGGDKLIEYVRAHATVPVIVSGRGNNFMFVHKEADFSKVIPLAINAKMQKISACNALDKVLIDRSLNDFASKTKQLVVALEAAGADVTLEGGLHAQLQVGKAEQDLDSAWGEEFLSPKIVLAAVNGLEEAIALTNAHSGGHSAAIVTEERAVAEAFMDAVDAAQVYWNASTRFSDGGQFGLGAELGISTEKLHHRGPLGLEQLVSNKWFCYGEGEQGFACRP